jgi:hypothetical protein
MLLAESPHGVVKLLLVSTVCLDLARVAAHNDAVEVFEDLKECVMLLVDVMQELAGHASIDDSICKRNAVITMAIRALVRAAKLLGPHVDLNQCQEVRGMLRLLIQAFSALADF